MILRSILIKEMQNSIDLTPAKVPRLRSTSILTPFPEQIVTKFTQQQLQMASAMPTRMIKEKLIFKLCQYFMLKILRFLSKEGDNSRDAFDQQLLFSLGLTKSYISSRYSLSKKHFKSSCGGRERNNVETNYNP